LFALVPILAQATTTVAVGDRTEVRARFDRYIGTAEAVTTPYGSVTTANTRQSLMLRYSPFLTLTNVNGTQDRTLLVLHSAQLIGQLRLRRTTLRFLQAGDYGTRNFVVDAFGDRGIANTPTGVPAAPTPPGTGVPGGNGTTGNGTTGNGTTGNGTTGNGNINRPTVAALPATVRYADSITQVNIDQALSRRSRTGAYLRYMVAGGLDESSRDVYPIIHTPSLGGYYTYEISPRSLVSSTAQGSYSISSTDIRTYTADALAGYRYRFTKNFSLGMSLGVGYARTTYADGAVLEYVYLTAGAGAGLGFNVEYRTKLYGGILTLYARAGYAPTLDQVAAVLDQRVTWAVGATWVRKRLAFYAGVGSSISLHLDQGGGLDAFNAALGGSYVLGGGFVVDAGARGVWQAYQGQTTIPPTAIVFAALSWGGSTSLGGRR